MRTLKQNKLFSNAFYCIYNNDVQFSNGDKGTHFIFEGADGSAILPITKGGEIILVSNYRYAVDKHLLALPCGCSDASSESFEQVARRELEEETGYRAGYCSYFGPIVTNPSVMSNESHVYVAWDCEPLKHSPAVDPHEEIAEVLTIPISKVVEMIMRGDIVDTLTVAMVLKLVCSISPIKPKALDGRSSAFINGMICCAAGKAKEYNSYRNRKSGPEYGEWLDGWMYYRFRSVV